MKKTIFLSILAVALVSVSTAHAADLGATAAASLSVGINGQNSSADAQVKASLGARSQDRGTQEIDRRIAALNKLDAKVAAMQRVSADSKSSLQATVNSQISDLTALKAKISADTDATTLKADIASITKSYRIFMVVIPQGAIMATADRIETTADLMTSFGAKLQTRISDAATAGHDVSAMQTSYADYTAKIADANTQASAALTLTSNLKPDNGDQSVIDSNKQALVDAHAKIKTGQTDLQTARADAAAIVKALKGFSVTTNTTASTTTTTQ